MSSLGPTNPHGAAFHNMNDRKQHSMTGISNYLHIDVSGVVTHLALTTTTVLSIDEWIHPHKKESTLIARFMGQHGAHLGPTGPRWAPCWPHEPCYLVDVINYQCPNLSSTISVKGQWCATTNYAISRNCELRFSIVLTFDIGLVMLLRATLQMS